MVLGWPEIQKVRVQKKGTTHDERQLSKKIINGLNFIDKSKNDL